jgi:peptidoglycan/xylan/chitin deacetylase (PgdA/CDA1 family)
VPQRALGCVRGPSRVIVAAILAALAGGCGTASSTVTGSESAGSTPTPAPTSAQPNTQPNSQPGASLPPLRTPPPPPPARPVHQSGPLPPMVYRIPTSQRVVFIGIDDGMTKDPAFLALIRARRIPVTAFLTDAHIRSDYGYFRELQHAGVGIQNHTLTHRQLNRLPFEAQKREICGAADRYRQIFGKRPVIMRPPYGSYNLTTRRAAKACGMRALVNWNVSLPGRKLRFATGSRLRPGDIILTHFRPTLMRDLVPVLDQIRREGFAIARLEDYV